MNILSSFLVALGLSMDNLAVTVSAGCTRCHTCTRWVCWRISILFALAHFVMFSVGFIGGELIPLGSAVGAWVSFLILLFIGLHMIGNAFTAKEQQELPSIFTSFHTQVALAVATSVDALFAGAGMGFSHLYFWQTVFPLVGCVLVTSFFGFQAGHLLGKKFGPAAEALGGSVLVLVGVKVLLEGLSIC